MTLIGNKRRIVETGNKYRVKVNRDWVEVDTLKEASKAIRDYIESKDMRSSEWFGGLLTDMDGKEIGRVSYNGRVWDTKGSEVAI